MIDWTAYLITAAGVALVVYCLLRRPRPTRHAWPTWVCFGLAWLVGVLWPALTLWALGYLIRVSAVAAWRWALGDHNKARIVRIDLPPSHAMGAFDPEAHRTRVWNEMFAPLYDADGKIKS